MRMTSIVATLMLAGMSAHAEETFKISAAPAPAAPPTTVSAPAKPAEDKTKLDAFADKERLDLQTFVEDVKLELDKFERKETVRLETVSKRVRSEPFTDEEKAKIKSLTSLMESSSAETRRQALYDLEENLREGKVKAIWGKYKAKKKALWQKFEQEWQTLLTQPPLMIHAKPEPKLPPTSRKKQVPVPAHAAPPTGK